MAKAKEKGGRWSMRQLYCGADLYVSGYKTRGEAEKAMTARVAEINPDRPPSGLGPHRTMVAQALQDYGMERLRFNKGAMQEVNRINRYLRAAGLELLSAKRRCNVAAAAAEVAQGDLDDHDDLDNYCDYGGDEEDDGGAGGDHQGKAVYFKVTLVPFTQERAVPAGLGGHRRKLKTATSKSDSLRGRLAATAVAKVTRHQVQGLIDALRQDGRGPATIGLERAVLRRLFNYARTGWSWPGLADNPASGLTMPKVANERDRVMSADEEVRLDEAMTECRNQLVAPTLKLLTETAMRSSEPLTYATWGDVNWAGNTLRLRDSKTLQRDVALSPRALEALRELRKHSSGEPTAPLVEITYEALKAAWQRACKRAGVAELKIHDLRHTAATRMALESGNLFLVQAMTGLKTLSQLTRYVNVKPADVAAFMHRHQDANSNVISGNFPQHKKRS